MNALARHMGIEAQPGVVAPKASDFDPLKPFAKNPKQQVADQVMRGPASHILLRGGSRSGKTFQLMRGLSVRAIKAPKSTHAVLRRNFNHLKHSIIYDSFPKMLALCFPELAGKVKLDKSDWFHEFPNGSRILYGGLDDKERTEKILGQEHSSIFLNEISQISYASRNKAVTRLAQNSGLKLRAYYDCNPPPTSHWSYAIWAEKLEPTSRKPLVNPEDYASVLINPTDNLANLPPGYLVQLQALPERDQIRFLRGEWTPAVVGALWSIEAIDREREPAPRDEIEVAELISRMVRVVIAVDPSGCEGDEDTRSDEIGIVAAGLDRDGRGYVLEDASGHYSPEGWADATIALYQKWRADVVVGEVNYGGDMVRAVLQSRPRGRGLPFKKIVASRGKHIRAQPVSSLYSEKDAKVAHVGRHVDLEAQLLNFSTAGYVGDRSPDRADAAIFALTELMISPDLSTGTMPIGGMT